MSYQYEDLINAKFEQVTPTGSDEYLCKCPFHDDRGRPNLYVNATSGLYLCHACGAKGHIGYAEKRPIDIQRRIRKMRQAQVERPIRVYDEKWLTQFTMDTEYWEEERGFSPATCSRFKLGYDAMSDSATIPMRNRQGEIHGVIRRRLDGTRPKYLDPKGVPKGRFLWGAWMIKNQKKVALTEGPSDALSLWDANIPALALMGARITPDQLATLHMLGIQQVVLMMDRDEAGRQAVVQVREQITGLHVSIGVYRYYWSGDDPDKLSKSQRKKMFHSAKRLIL